MIFSFACILIISTPADGKEYSLPAGSSVTYSLGDMDKGDIFTVKWKITDFDDDNIFNYDKLSINVEIDGDIESSWYLTSAEGKETYRLPESGYVKIIAENNNFMDSIKIDLEVAKGAGICMPCGVFLIVPLVLIWGYLRFFPSISKKEK